MKTSRRLYFIQQYLGQHFYNGSIGNVDIEKVLTGLEIAPIYFPYHDEFSLKAKVARFLYLIRTFFLLENKSVIIFEYPLYARLTRILLWLLQSRRSIKVICIVGDINGLKYGNAVTLRKDLRFLKRYNHFVLHNENMRLWLEPRIFVQRFSFLQFFDFLAKPSFSVRTNSGIIAFAGNLEKSPFIQQLNELKTSQPTLHFNIYGQGADVNLLSHSNITYKGIFEPYSLPQILEGSYGLVWDGEGIEAPMGSMGKYMEYISHHKLSLYILSGLPIIIYERAGSAYLINQYAIGFTVKSLFDIERKIKAISDKEYEQMRLNTVELAKKLSSGGCLKSALKELLPEDSFIAKQQ